MTEKRTPAQWVEYLGQEHQPITLTEFMAGCLARMLGAQIETANATQHTEGILGAMDEMFSRHDPAYKSDGTVRAALDQRRDEQRKLAG